MLISIHHDKLQLELSHCMPNYIHCIITKTNEVILLDKGLCGTDYTLCLKHLTSMLHDAMTVMLLGVHVIICISRLR